ncbi:MAG: tetratricopeptide repeat protein [Firmicutes bacterium]|nr:tetratricopeptide repeat protein [Bacillota bacterium]
MTASGIFCKKRTDGFRPVKTTLFFFMVVALFMFSGCGGGQGQSPGPDNPDAKVKNPGAVNSPPPRYDEDANIRVSKRKYVPKEVWDVEGTPNQEKERMYLGKALEKDPDNPEILFLLGFNNLEANRQDEALSYFKKAIEKKPDYKVAYQNLADLYLRKKDYSEAEKTVESGLKYFSNDPSLVNSMVQIKLERDGDSKGAEKIILSAMKDKSSDPRLNFALAQIYFEQDENEKGMKLLEDSVKNFPLYPNSYILLAEKYRDEKKDPNSGIKLLNKIIELVPSYSDSYMALGDLYLDKGEYRKAEAQYTLCLSKNPDSPGEIYIQTGKAYLGMNRPAGAIRNFRRALELKQGNEDDPIELEALLGIAKAHILKGNQTEAENALKEAASKKKNNPSVTLVKADLLYSQKKYDEALKLLQSVKSGKDEEDDDNIVWEKHWRMARICKKTGRTDMAEKYLKEAVKEAPPYKKELIENSVE